MHISLSRQIILGTTLLMFGAAGAKAECAPYTVLLRNKTDQTIAGNLIIYQGAYGDARNYTALAQDRQILPLPVVSSPTPVETGYFSGNVTLYGPKYMNVVCFTPISIVNGCPALKRLQAVFTVTPGATPADLPTCSMTLND